MAHKTLSKSSPPSFFLPPPPYFSILGAQPAKLARAQKSAALTYLHSTSESRAAVSTDSTISIELVITGDMPN